MKATNECYPCLANLVRQAAGLATEDPELKAKAIEEGLKLLDREFSTEKVSIAVATPLHRLVRMVTGNPDPYRLMKEAEVDMARSLRKGWRNNPEANLRDYMVLAVLGNNIDFFKDLKQIKKDIGMPVEFAVDHIKELESKLKKTRRILYLADNAGEVFFDLPLVEKLQDFAPVTYVVKESPVQNDITLADLKEFGLANELRRVITTGTDTPGVDMAMASDEFKLEFDAADLVLAKGMGYWETLSELKPQGKVFYLLKAKCKPVADSLDVELNSYVALLR
ncbi:MAG TPA: ARMT1-like domain-containing protein [Dehalococcoidia bacterium]|nr:ARMT1-like domain-containing protein [Dehalococcoidia bacterium]